MSGKWRKLNTGKANKAKKIGWAGHVARKIKLKIRTKL
jgi:hypothetical protein